MIQKRLMITGIQKQVRLLEDMVRRMEEDGAWDRKQFYQERARLIAVNLRKLRMIQKNYARHLFGVSERALNN